MAKMLRFFLAAPRKDVPAAQDAMKQTLARLKEALPTAGAK